MRVSIADLKVAAEWLEANEGEDGEQASCLRVSDWLRAEIARRNEAAAVAKVVKRTGASNAKARELLRRQGRS